MDHRDFVAQIDPDTRATLTAKNDRSALIRLAGLTGVIATLITIIALKPPLWALAVPALGILWAFLFTLQHECTHKTPFRSPAMNEWVGHITGLILVQPFQWFRYFHLAHHKYTNIPDRDPELEGDAKPDTWGAFLLHLSCITYWQGKIGTLANNALYPLSYRYLPEQAKPKLRTEARLMLLAYGVATLLLIYNPSLFWIWPGPLLLGFPRCASIFWPNMDAAHRSPICSRTPALRSPMR